MTDNDEEYFENPIVFEADSMRRLHQAQFDKFVDLRVRGVRNDIAFAKAFPRYARPNDLRQAQERLAYLEATDWYIDEFDRRLKAVPIDELLSERRALHGFVSMWNDPDEKGHTRANALKEACVLAGITVVVDDEGKTKRAGRSLSDFYQERAKQTLPPAPPGEADKPTALH